MTLLYSFGNDGANRLDGDGPQGDLTFGRNGELYGATSGGGTNDTGTIFKCTTSGSLTTLYSFSAAGQYGVNTDGTNPTGELLFGSDGNIYGTTAEGGPSNGGTVFSITPAGDLTTLYSFQKDLYLGSNPPQGLTAVGDGALYGTTFNGGENGGTGTVYKLTTPSLQTSSRFDFNKDGHADLIWHNTTSGDVSVWGMNDQTVLSYGASFASVAPSSGWTPVAAPDVNDDGYPDLLWWNSQTGELSFWTLNGDKIAKTYGDFATIADTNWKPVAAADVTGTTWELIFQNTATGDISAWQMSRRTVTSYGATLASLGANSPYQIVGAPDLDGDGKSDLLFWDSATGGVSYWSCNLANGQVFGYHGDFTSLTDTSWHLVGSEDTNGDGHPDLLWWNATMGEVSRWLLDGPTVTQYGGDTATVADTTWQPTAIR